jgi:hypothetical protein
MRKISALVFLVCAFTAISLGVQGFQQLDGAVLSTSIYQALQLFTFQGGDVDGKVPLNLEIARWLAPATTLGSLYAAAYTFFGQFWGRIRLAAFIRNHIVICGAGRKGLSLIRDLLQEKPRRAIVVIEPLEMTDREELQRAGVVILQGKAGEAEFFKIAKLGRAAALVCLTGDDSTNIGIALAATACLPESRNDNPLAIHVHVADVDRRHILQRNQILDLEQDPRHRIRLFNCFVNRARRTWAHHPLEWDPACGLCEEVHLVIGEMGSMEKAMIVQAAHIGHFLDGKRVTLHLISKKAAEDAHQLLKDYPGFESCARLEVAQIRVTEDFVDAVLVAGSQVGSAALFTVVASSRDAPAALSEALVLGERFRTMNHQLFLRVLLDVPSGDPVRQVVEANEMLRSWIQFLPDMDEACGMEAVFLQNLDLTAKRIHECWKEGTEKQILHAESLGDEATATRHKNKETYRDWEALSEEQKDVNRLAADHINTKIRAMGVDPSRMDEVEAAWVSMDPASLERLSRMEHERWAAPYRMAGWKSGARDVTKRTHPDLCDYDLLDEATQKYDCDQVLKIPTYLNFS